MNSKEYINSRALKVKSNEVLDDYSFINEFILKNSKEVISDEQVHISIIFLYLAELFSLIENLELSACYQHIQKFSQLDTFKFSEKHLELIQQRTKRYKAEQIGYVIDIYHQFFISNKKNDTDSKVDFKKASGYRKMRGAFYTPYEVASLIVKKTFEEIQKNKFTNPKILDLGCGTGVFLSSICHLLIENNYKKNEILNELVFGIDVEHLSTVIAQILIQAELKIPLQDIVKLDHIKTLDILFNDDDIGLFAKIKGGDYYDAIVMNPPYDRLKPDGASESERNLIEQRINHIKNNSIFKNSSSGSINMYSLFIDKSISMLRPNGVVGAIVPMTLLADKSATNIRKFFIEKKAFCEIYVYPESAKIFENVTQACSIFIANLGGNNDPISIRNMSSINNVEFETSISHDVIKSASPSYLPIPCVHQSEVSLIEKLHKFPRIKDIKEISNRRGELDLTLDKKYLLGSDKCLLKGISVGLFRLKETFNLDFEGFTKAKEKSSASRANDIYKVRIAGQQISNLGSKQRLKFVQVPKNYILGNSLNYFTVDDKLSDQNSFNIYSLLGFLNSEILNWRFKLTSSNNHVNNYELDDLPIPINAPKDKIRRLNEIVLRLSDQSQDSKLNLELLDRMNEAVLDCYNLSNKDYYKN
jgi:adenine-specific DNA-methyltransferase